MLSDLHVHATGWKGERVGVLVIVRGGVLWRRECVSIERQKMDMDSLSAEEANLAYLGVDVEGSGCEVAVKVICLGDSAVGKSKCVERFLLDAFQPRQLSTYALTLYTHRTTIKGAGVRVDFWDTAGQEQFNNLHPSYFHAAHACVLLFDATRKVTF